MRCGEGPNYVVESVNFICRVGDFVHFIRRAQVAFSARSCASRLPLGSSKLKAESVSNLLELLRVESLIPCVEAAAVAPCSAEGFVSGRESQNR